MKDLRIPLRKSPREISSVEASKRLDAIASAGFGLSRSKIIKQLKTGKVRMNWEPIHSASRSLSIGDRIQLEGKGSVEIIHIEQTKRERWRVELLKK